MTWRGVKVTRTLLLVFAAVQAVLYSSLLPLWEGFDEPWHYGYVQHFAIAHALPVLGRTKLSKEIWHSMLTCPVSHVVHSAWPELQTFDAYFALPPEARAQERQALESLPTSDAYLPSDHANYEIQQAPLAYAVLAIPDWLLRELPLPTRILWLRIMNASLSAAVAFFAAESLFRRLGLPGPYRAMGLFFLFAGQMYWAATAHISSDGIAIALCIWFFAALADFAQRPDRSRTLRLGFVTACGLLAKAYFLPLAAAAFAIVAWRQIRRLLIFVAAAALLAGPWYVRNILLYHGVTGLLMTNAGISPVSVLSALARVDWARTLPYMLRATLWTGNNSFIDFSRITLDAVLVLLASGLVLYAFQIWRVRKVPAADLAVLTAAAAFSLAVIYVAGNDVLLLHGTSAGAAPWYTIPLLPPGLAFALLGMSRARRLGHILAVCLCAIWTYVAIATYAAKLIPLYGGFPAGKSTLSNLFRWYWTQHGQLVAMLSTISLASPVLIFAAAVVAAMIAVALAIRLARAMRSPLGGTPEIGAMDR
jgi:hypothetical protein